jgi:FkbM family methyltransferase
MFSRSFITLPFTPIILRSIWKYFHHAFPVQALSIEFIRKNRNFEKDLWLVKSFCGKDSVSIDIGANNGLYSLFMSRYSAKVVAFECNPSLIGRLSSIMPDNVQINGVALSHSAGLTELRFDPSNTGIGTIESRNTLLNNPGISSIKSVAVPTRCLDDYNLVNVSFIKIDVEGHELDCLKGASLLLETLRPVLLIEIEERHCPGNLCKVPEYLSNFGYLPFVLSTNGKYLVPIADLASHAVRGTNNFWFVPLE